MKPCQCGCGGYIKSPDKQGRERAFIRGHNRRTGVYVTSNLGYRSWIALKQRCYNKARKDYHNWGGRGITVCDRWLGKDGWANFYADMGDRPVGKTLDRIDTNGNYEPGNCRWASISEQNSNQRRWRAPDEKDLAAMRTKAVVLEEGSTGAASTEDASEG